MLTIFSRANQNIINSIAKKDAVYDLIGANIKQVIVKQLAGYLITEAVQLVTKTNRHLIKSDSPCGKNLDGLLANL